jgi:GNAT superfamily N-acetyltransferase
MTTDRSATGHHDTVMEALAVRQAWLAADVLADSHAAYPAFAAVFPQPRRRARALAPFLTATARDAARAGHCVVARDRNEVLGAALWMPPGTFPLSVTRKARMGPALLRTAAAAPRSFQQFARLGSAVEDALPPDPGWFLQAMGVRSRAQGRGLGTRLVAWGLQRADRQGIGSHLFTSDEANVDYYARFGFTRTGPPVATYPGGPTYLGMHREPHAAPVRPDASSDATA